MAGLSLLLRRGGLAPHPVMNDYILSENRGDPEVFRILMEKGVSSDGVGITKEDAKKVTTIGFWFRGNTTIVSFDEFRYFTGVTSLYASSPSESSFKGCTSLQSIELPDSINKVIGDGHENSNGGYGVFMGCTSLTRVKMSDSLLAVPACFLFNAPIEDIVIPWQSLTSIGRYFINKGTLQYDTLELSSLETYDYAALIGVSVRKLIMPLVKTLPQANYARVLPKGLKVLELGENVTSLPWHSFYGFGTNTLVIRTATPPSITESTFSSVPGAVYVPDASVDAYKAATHWSKYASVIKPLSEYIPS